MTVRLIPAWCHSSNKQYNRIEILFGNETEALAFAEAQKFGTEDLREIGLKISALPKQNESRKRIAIITQGSDPVLLIRDGTITEFPVEKLSADQIVDTNGAGDAFVGGFLAQLVQERSFDTCIKCWYLGRT
nr:adenosine kinase-like isoform X1 [Aedes albopictus]XP_029736207.1 adenosine kinase-like isoform X2 [Aedes albopictus]